MFMIELRLSAEKLVAHAQSSGHNRIHDEDLGYATHCWLMAAFGNVAPDCFRLSETRHGGLRLLGYSQTAAEGMKAQADTFATPRAHAVADWSAFASKSLANTPFDTGKTLGFEVRVCPVRRGREGERDAYLSAVEASTKPGSPDRAAVYAEWLDERLCGMAELDRSMTQMTAFRLVDTWRRRHDARGRAGKGTRLVRPDALMRGRLSIKDAEGFRSLLGRGIGRHRAFGFGMLLLRPV